jgi:hypothetical protein
MYRLELINFSNVMDISLSEPLPDEIDREDQMLEAKLRTEFAILACQRPREGYFRSAIAS